MTTFQVLAWRGIPVGVKAKDADGEVRQNLPPRFQKAVDAAAAACGQTEAGSYLNGWKWGEPQERPGAARQVAEAVAAELDVNYSPEQILEIRRGLPGAERGSESLAGTGSAEGRPARTSTMRPTIPRDRNQSEERKRDERAAQRDVRQAG